MDTSSMWPADWLLQSAIHCRWIVNKQHDNDCHLPDSPSLLLKPALFSSVIWRALCGTDCVVPIMQVCWITPVQRPHLYPLECLQQHRAKLAHMLYAISCTSAYLQLEAHTLNSSVHQRRWTPCVVGLCVAQTRATIGIN